MMKRLTTRFMSLVLVCLLPMIALSFYNLYRNFDQRDDLVRDRMQQISKGYTGEFNAAIRAGRQILRALGESREVRDGDTSECSAIMRRIHRLYSGYSAFARITEGGMIDCSSVPDRETLDVSDMAAFREALETRQFTISNFLTGPASGQSIVALAQPVGDGNGNPAGVIATGLRLDWVQTILVGHLEAPGIRTTVIDANNRIVSDFGDQALFGPLRPIGSTLEDRDLLNLIRSPRIGQLVKWKDGGSDRIALVTRMPQMLQAPLILVQADADAIRHNVAGDLVIQAVLVVSLTLFALALAWLGVRLFVLRWLERFASTTSRIVEGDFQARLPEAGNGGAEFGDLAVLYNRMADSMTALERSILDASTSPTAVIGADGKLVMVNACWNDPDHMPMPPVPPGEDVVRRFIRMAQEFPAMGGLSIAIQAILSGSENSCIVEMPSESDGRWHDAVVAPIKFGERHGAILFFLDVTERKRLDRELAEKKVLLERAEAMAQVGHWRIDMKTRDVYWSGAVYDIHGLSPDEVRLNYPDITGYYHPADAPAVRWILEQAMSSKQPFEFEKRLIRRDGEERLIECQGGCDLDSKGRVRALFGILRDITEERSKQRALEQARQEAEALNRAKTQFLANMSHELRTPLNAIIGFSEMLSSESYGQRTAEQTRTVAGYILESGHHLLGLVNDLLDMSQIEHGAIPLREERVSPRQVIDDALTMIREQADRSGLLLEVCFNQVPDVEVDPRMIRQVLLNVIGNSIRFTPSGGRIVVGTERRPDGGVLIRVTDTGPGIPGDVLESLDRPFALDHNPYIRDKRGAGLGLPISKALMKQHDGRLEISSRPGQGTEVRLVIPAARIREGEVLLPDAG